MGRAECLDGAGEVGNDTTVVEGVEEGAPTGLEAYHDLSLFFTDTTTNDNIGIFGVYSRTGVEVLGEEDDSSIPTLRRHACFNCGSSEHKVYECPHPKDRDLIYVSRALHQHVAEPSKNRRVHNVVEWKQQRLEWLDFFEPGVIKGETLLDALGSEHPGWLHNISLFGYPRGWVGPRDPRDVVRRRVLDQCCNMESGTEDTFTIFGEEIETVNITDKESTENNPVVPDETRWAVYPKSHFLYELLPVYEPAVNQILPPPSFLNTVVDEWDMWKHELWEHILLTSSRPADVVSLHDMIHRYVSYVSYIGALPPPPPSSEPPPLPPPESPPPPPPMPTLSSASEAVKHPEDLDDMDLSD